MQTSEISCRCSLCILRLFWLVSFSRECVQSNFGSDDCSDLLVTRHMLSQVLRSDALPNNVLDLLLRHAGMLLSVAVSGPQEQGSRG